MPRFFVDNINGDSALIIGEDANHIGRSLRMKTGENITLCCDGYDYSCKIESITDSDVSCSILEKCKSISEPNVILTLYQAIPKLDKFETIIQKSVELGVNRIVPVLTSRCISRPDEKSFSKKLDRFQKISLEAAKQSGRALIPEITNVISFKTAIDEMSKMDLGLICYEKGGQALSEVGLLPNKAISIIIGSEGGFDTSEVEQAKEKGIIPIWLGNRILRCETAPLAAISIIMNLTGNM